METTVDHDVDRDTRMSEERYDARRAAALVVSMPTPRPLVFLLWLLGAAAALALTRAVSPSPQRSPECP